MSYPTFSCLRHKLLYLAGLRRRGRHKNLEVGSCGQSRLRLIRVGDVAGVTVGRENTHAPHTMTVDIGDKGICRHLMKAILEVEKRHQFLILFWFGLRKSQHRTFTPVGERIHDGREGVPTCEVPVCAPLPHFSSHLFPNSHACVRASPRPWQPSSFLIVTWWRVSF